MATHRKACTGQEPPIDAQSRHFDEELRLKVSPHPNLLLVAKREEKSN